MKRIYYGWAIVGLAALTYMLVYGATFAAFGLFVLPVSEDFGLSRAEMNTGFVLLNLGVAALSPLIGRLLDYFPVRRIMMICVVLLGLSLATLGLSHSVWLSAGVFVPLAAGLVGVAMLTMPLMVARWFKSQRGRAMAISVLGASLGGVVVAPIVSVLIQTYGWRNALLITAGAETALLFVIAALVRDRPGENDVEPGAAATATSAAPAPAPAGPPFKVAEVLRMRDFWAIALTLSVASAVGQGLTISLVPLAHSADLTTLQATSLISIVGAAAIGAQLLLAAIADKVDRVLMIAGVCALGIVLNGALYFSNSYGMFVVCALILGAMSSVMSPLSAALFADRFGVNSFGTVRGMSGPIIAVTTATTIRFAGEVYDRTGGYHLLFVCLAIAEFVALCLMISVRYTKKPVLRVTAPSTVD